MERVARAGFACVELESGSGASLMGYGARKGTATGRHDAIHARALFCDDGADGRLLLVELDLCLLAVPQANGVRERIADATGLAPDAIAVACIHTHSAPDTDLIGALSGRAPGPAVAALLDAAVAAGVAASESAAPARLGAGRAPVSIGRNRRVAGGAVEPHALVVRIDREDGSPWIVVYAHGCHPTALGHDNLEISADWPGAANRAIEAALPGVHAMFVLGAHGDVDPRTRGLLDLAIPDQSVGVDFDEMEALGREVGVAVAAAAASLETRAGFAVAAGSVRVPLPIVGAARGAEARASLLARRAADARDALGLADDVEPRVPEWYRLLDETIARLPAAERRARAARVRLLLRDRTAARIAGSLTPEVEVQVLRLGPVWLLALPLEVTADVGALWREGSPDLAATVSIANGWLRYLPHPRHFDAPGAEERYEILNATFEPEAAEVLVSAGAELRARLARNRERGAARA